MRPFLVLAAAPALVLGFLGCGEDAPSDDPWSGSPDRFEIDDSRDEAKEQAVHMKPPKHTFSPDGDEDYIRFRVTELHTGDILAGEPGPFYRIGLLSAVGSTRVRLLDAGGALLTSSASAIDLPQMTDPGIYYLHVLETTGAGGQYKPAIVVWKDMIWTTGEADAGAAPDLVVSSVSVPGAVSLGETLDLNVRFGNQGGLGVPAGLPFRMTAYVSDTRSVTGATEIGWKDISGIDRWNFLDETLNVTFDPALTPGPVYVIVKAEELAAESDRSNNAAVASTLLEVTAGDWHEPDETPLEADAVAGIGTTAPDLADLTLFDAMDVDLVKLIDLDPADYLEIWSDRLRGGADTMLEIIQADETVVMSAEDGGQENGASYLVVPPGALVSGDYYVRVTDEAGSTGGYDLHARAGPNLPDPEEPDDIFEPECGIATWRSMLPGETVSRNFSGDGADVDYMVYPVSVTASATTHSIATRNVSAGCTTRLTLLNGDGTNKALGSAVAAGESEIMNITLEAAMYYIKVENISLPLVAGSYQMLTSN